MAKINYKYYSGTDTYNDGIIEKELLEHYKYNVKIDKYRDDIFFLTSKIRENILNWYPFTKSDSVLEVGAGTGVLTEMLCNNCGHVTSVEDSLRRSEILYERNKDKNNLDVFVGNFNIMNFERKFDYIILIGVFEYSKIFCDSDSPFNDFLENLKKLLNDNGKILIAIENRYGIKYFAGSNEDHLRKPYLGLYGYGNKKVQTFGMEEIKEIIETVGFSKYKFYYPFPDYKMPSVIYTDKFLPESSDKLPTYSHYNETNCFDVNLVMKGIIKNKNFGFFANSFLVELANEKGTLSNIAYAKAPTNRCDSYRVGTIIKDDGTIIKIPLNHESTNHLIELEKTHNEMLSKNIKCCKVKLKKGSLEIEKIDGNRVSNVLCDYIRNGETQLALNLIEKAILLIKSISLKMGETEYLKVGLLDLNFNNMIIRNGEIIIIDQEWKTEKLVETNYAIYFSLKLLYESNIDLNDFLDLKALYKKYKITSNMAKNFDKFSNNYFYTEKESFDKNISNILTKRSSKNDSESFYDKQIKQANEKIKAQYNELVNKDTIIMSKQKEINEASDNMKKMMSQIEDLNGQLNKLNNKFVIKFPRKIKNIILRK